MRGIISFSRGALRQDFRRQPMFHRVFRADSSAIRSALMELKGRFQPYADDDVIGRLELALAEVLNNICEHGVQIMSIPARTEFSDRPDGAGTRDVPLIHLCVIRQDNGLICAVTDDGVPLPDSCLRGPDYQIEMRGRQLDAGLVAELPEGGFGWSLIQGLTHSIRYIREDRRNVLAFTVPDQDSDPGRAPAQLALS
ncbi:ATP-binding protein [Paracoccus sp. DMF-8]|uniref:ATP-binding protein n=1 Tax=Paracoccus sp. DMF-8 TaxID=3019445 RepID=UPI0023E8B716|nr:ATP-binding protein [Paracoccus sp. DMF-8]MDF3606733.1 ATP-binding protein [Paracoccus sp. DMF-8]